MPYVRITNKQYFGLAVALAAALVVSTLARADEAIGDRQLFELDEGSWAMFYDLPSRRFRANRDAFVRRDSQMAERDIAVSIGFMSIELDRTAENLRAPMADSVNRLKEIQLNLANTSLSAGDLDSVFARTHWLLAQHYLILSRRARDAERPQTAGRYLWATAHHLERTVLWSDVPVDRSLAKLLDSIREMGAELQSTARPESVYRDKPIVLTAKTLTEVGEYLDRRVWISANLEALE